MHENKGERESASKSERERERDMSPVCIVSGLCVCVCVCMCMCMCVFVFMCVCVFALTLRGNTCTTSRPSPWRVTFRGCSHSFMAFPTTRHQAEQMGKDRGWIHKRKSIISKMPFHMDKQAPKQNRHLQRLLALFLSSKCSGVGVKPNNRATDVGYNVQIPCQNVRVSPKE